MVMTRPRLLVAAIAAGLMAGLAVAALAAPHAQASKPKPAACQVRTFEGSRFTVCPYRPASQSFRLAWGDRDGRPLDSLKVLAASLGADAPHLAFAMNAGMYETDGRPLGLYVEGGETKRRLRAGDGTGNFYLKPNGVLSVDAGGALAIRTTEAYLARDDHPRWATQSGPMLLIDGALHPAIDPDGPSRLIRNGVGLGDPSVAYFVISDDPVSFGRFARFFRDRLSCRDALFLDGTVSSLWAPGLGRRDPREGLGPMLLVLDRH